MIKRQRNILFTAPLLLLLMAGNAQNQRFKHRDSTVEKGQYLLEHFPLQLHLSGAYSFRPENSNSLMPAEVHNSVKDNMRKGVAYGLEITHPLTPNWGIGIMGSQAFYRSQADIVITYPDQLVVSGLLNNELKLSFLGAGVNYTLPIRNYKDQLSASFYAGYCQYTEDMYLLNSLLEYQAETLGFYLKIAYNLKLSDHFYFSVFAGYQSATASNISITNGIQGLQMNDPDFNFNLGRVDAGGGLSIKLY